MYRKVWANAHCSVCSLSFLSGNDKVSSGSAFLADGRLITNNHVIQVPPATHVRVCFVGDDGSTETASTVLTVREFGAKLLDGQPESSWDYAIFDVWDEFSDLPSLKFAETSWAPTIGQPVAMLGFHFDNENLSVHGGVLASSYSRGEVRYLQIDGSVNQGNSGGPLIDAETGAVIGIVTRKATGLTRQFDQLLQSFEENIKALEGAQSVMRVGAVDPLEALTVSQRQMALVAQEMKRSANVGIGYAYTADRVRRSLELLSE